MTIPSGPQPSPGDVSIGQIFIRAADRTMWFGVPNTQDPAQSVLVGDLNGLMGADADNLNTAKAYTDSVATGKANVVHDHVISDVIGLQAALDANNNALPSGCIVLWSGALADIPAGWLICNGSSGTPDLRDRFVMGGGGSNTALSTGGGINKSATTTNNGGHTPTGTVGGTALSIAQMPVHDHGGLTSVNGNHAHNVLGGIVLNIAGSPGPTSIFQFAGASPILGTDTQGNHQHGINAQGSGTTHTHSLTMSAVGGHTHDVSMNVLPPYIVLGYIMKV